MLTHYNPDTSKIRVQILFIIFISFIYTFSTFQKSSQEQLFPTNFSGQEYAFDDFKDSICFLLKSKSSKDSIKNINNSLSQTTTAFEKFVDGNFPYQSSWHKPAYYSFLFRYNLF